MRTSQLLLLLAGLVTFQLAVAGNPSDLQEVPGAGPDPVGPMEDGQAIEPDVTIVQRKDATVQEYRVNGRLYMVKIKPIIGPSYYLVDQDGDGRLEARVGNLANQNPVIPQWVIFSW